MCRNSISGHLKGVKFKKFLDPTGGLTAPPDPQLNNSAATRLRDTHFVRVLKIIIIGHNNQGLLRATTPSVPRLSIIPLYFNVSLVPVMVALITSASSFYRTVQNSTEGSTISGQTKHHLSTILSSFKAENRFAGVYKKEEACKPFLMV